MTEPNAQTQTTAYQIYKPWTGVSPKYQPFEVETELLAYLAICQASKTIPNIPEFQGFLGISYKTWGRYKTHKNQRYVRAIARCEEALEASYWSKLLHKSPVVQKLYAINKLGCVEKREVHHTGQINHQVIVANLDGKLNSRLGIGDTPLLPEK